ncbi:MAG: 23S rRNA (adenine(2503)-C(2))-methyltransferase RlmN [Firmicutes bacterium]|nr:23S rRNA (adenine(2503)-C(2))-methyltransferase RlmN [Bacillota bacterium]
MLNLRDLTVKELEEYFVSIGEKPFRAKQVFEWLNRGVDSFDEMSNIPKELRERLSDAEASDDITIGRINILRKQESRTDGTIKYLFQLRESIAVESVFMKYKYGNSICVSSQAGCRMGCAFCASTIGGLTRNLSAGEILMQVIGAERDTGEKISHVVIMGTGEPFDNYDNIVKFINLVHEPKGLGLSMRNITVSTCGLVPKIMEFARDLPQVNLAVSLHAPNDEVRSRIMPVNRTYNVARLISECKRYTEATHRRITFEYALIAGVNDAPGQADELADLLKGMLCHVNLIPLNEVSETGLAGSPKAQVQAFLAQLEARGITATVRRELGSDIDAACGQLRLAHKKEN